MQDALITGFISAMTAVITLLVKSFVDNRREEKKLRKDEAQRIADERDYYRVQKQIWADYAYQIRRIALDHGVKTGDLPDAPERKNRDK